MSREINFSSIEPMEKFRLEQKVTPDVKHIWDNPRIGVSFNFQEGGGGLRWSFNRFLPSVSQVPEI